MHAEPADEPAAGTPAPDYAPGVLWTMLQERAREATADGTLVPLETRARVLPDGGIPFSIQYASTLRVRHADAQSGAARENPFLPPEPELTVAALPPHHLAVLNRYPVIDHHLLVVTRDFEEQALPIGAGDFEALALCLAEIDGLGFYNAGPEAGASQPHRHLQLVPFPIAGGPRPTPIEPAIAGAVEDAGGGTLPALPFRHAAAPLPPTVWQVDDPAERARRAAEAMRLAYRALARRVGIRLAPGTPAAPYNLLVTRRWMLVVPRRRAGFEGVSINALGFAGSILIRNKAQWEAVQRHGPLEILRQVSIE